MTSITLLKRVAFPVALPFALPISLGSFFRRRLTVQQAESAVRAELGTRRSRFLHLVRTEVFDAPESPYLKLIKIAGCEFGDIVTRVNNDGIEAALSELAERGVYFTDSEFRGLVDTVRGGHSFRVSPSAFRPKASPRLSGPPSRTSGTTSRAVSSFISLPWLEKEALAGGLFYESHALLNHKHAIFDSLRPGTGGMSDMMILAKFGVGPTRWFARRPPGGRRQLLYDTMLAYELTLAGRAAGPGFARPEIVDDSSIARIARWCAKEHSRGNSTAIRCVASGAARVANVAWEQGISLEGLIFLASGEPMTEAKQRVIERSGARFTVLYGFDPGAVHVGFGCPDREWADEMHIPEHTLAVIEHPKARAIGEETIRPLLYTTLYPTNAALRLNLESGDYAVLRRRQCDSLMAQVGLDLHIHSVASHEKFTSEGLSYNYYPLFEFIESTLPNEFGGRLGDYQLVEEEDESGRTRLTLMIDPAVGSVDEGAVLDRLLRKLEEGTPADRDTARRWQRAGAVRTKRAPPVMSDRGKILPLRRFS